MHVLYSIIIIWRSSVYYEHHTVPTDCFHQLATGDENDKDISLMKY